MQTSACGKPVSGHWLGDAQSGFTLTDLLAVMAIIILVSGFILPAMSNAHTQSKVRRLICMSNGKQLVQATQLYAGDNSDLLMPNPEDANTVPGHYWCGGLVGGLPGATNLSILTNASNNLLAVYVGENVSVFKCPADDKGLQTRGKIYQRVRSVALNHAIGTICGGFNSGSAHSGTSPVFPVNGSWLDGNHFHRSGFPFKTFGRSSDFLRPSLTWVYLDESGVSINDATFVMSVGQEKWIDWPGTYHEMAAGVAFADGHTEIHPWIVSTTQPQGDLPFQLMVTGDSRDWKWLAERTTFQQRW